MHQKMENMAEITKDIKSLFQEYERPETTVFAPIGNINVHEWEKKKKRSL